jgi:hypothetical protein
MWPAHTGHRVKRFWRRGWPFAMVLLVFSLGASASEQNLECQVTGHSTRVDVPAVGTVVHVRLAHGVITLIMGGAAKELRFDERVVLEEYRLVGDSDGGRRDARSRGSGSTAHDPAAAPSDEWNRQRIALARSLLAPAASAPDASDSAPPAPRRHARRPPHE